MRHRWVICSLLFAGATINYIDRQVLAVLKPTLQAGGMGGAIGGIVMAQTAGRILQVTGSYHALFVMAASAYLVALAAIHALSPRLAPAVLLTGGGR